MVDFTKTKSNLKMISYYYAKAYRDIHPEQFEQEEKINGQISK